MFRSLFDIQSPRACGQGEMRESSGKIADRRPQSWNGLYRTPAAG
jgi:hypothetical protein